ncbi:failed axon connections [Staphylotrichum tortipilum]|uniref:Failed axon connections n=1 Tax=Staphylotrichum tortipilum TaxID=2831512 RepID=A0AAN6RSH4_9PEZI|nr:failed axon connections [Staphylotrichum longicolle]
MTTKFTIYRGFPTTPAHVWSPFVNKLETRFRLAGLPYRIDIGSPRQAPRGKIPYLAVTAEGSSSSSPATLLGDTALITRKLVDDGALPDLNAALPPALRARDLALRALLEDRLYFCLQRERWVDNYYAMRDEVLGALPLPARVLVGNLAYRGVTAGLESQGTGRYEKEEVREMKREVWEGVEALLVESRAAAGSGSRNAPFWVLGRPEPTEADATVYGFVAASLVCTAAPETQKTVRSFPVIVDYAKRIHDAYFGDYDIWEDKV